ncbi:HlyD family secretion protein [Pseudomonas sp. FSL W5-0299]|jgi:membrane fusion protein (multidrug efflux system)|uniref:HlyD family secretion protein n=1 Tax=Pseudomonas sp. FSL W5-0299 TaxID=1917484 RepID=UPI00098A50FB|nr:HlyD family secretion protein [Pseudomonas sp. FSL W5-0299]MBA4361616.1 HlyD family secretion protein [Pseudomonas sp.]OOL38273.1 hemolysin secretion protein D [Pseudomonas sp. FSL W5-0299]
MAESTLQRHAVQAEARPLDRLAKPDAQAPEAPTLDRHGPESSGAPRQRWRVGLFLLAPIVVVACGAWYVLGGQVVSTDNAYVQAERVGVSTDVAGIVAAIEVSDNQVVSKGQVLFRLKPEPFEIALASASAQLEGARNQILYLKASYNQSLAEIAQAEARLPYYQTNFQRLEKLVSVAAVSKTIYDDAHQDLDNTRQQVLVAKSQAAAALAQLGGRLDRPLEQHPSYLQAQAALNEAERNLRNSVVTAPFDGVVTNVDSLQVGAYLQPPQSGFSLVSSEHLWVAASPKETELTNAHVGQDATIEVDTYPGVTWHGTVESISPASSSSFSLLPAQNTTGNWVKVVQRIPVRIRIDDAVGKPALRHGMSALVEIDTGTARGLPKPLANLLARHHE